MDVGRVIWVLAQRFKCKSCAAAKIASGDKDASAGNFLYTDVRVMQCRHVHRQLVSESVACSPSPSASPSNSDARWWRCLGLKGRFHPTA